MKFSRTYGVIRANSPSYKDVEIAVRKARIDFETHKVFVTQRREMVLGLKQEAIKTILCCVEQGDTVKCFSVMEFNLYSIDLIAFLNILTNKDVVIIAEKENINTAKDVSVLQIFRSMQINDMENRAFRKATYHEKRGRPEAFTKDEFNSVIERMNKGDIKTSTQAIYELNTSKSTFYRCLREYRKKLSEVDAFIDSSLAIDEDYDIRLDFDPDDVPCYE